MSGSALRYPSVIERYFTKRFVRGSNNEDLCILEHSNRICLVTLASKHPVLAEGLVKKVDYNIDGRNLQTSNNVSGKKKKGAIKTKPRMPICKVTGASGNDYLIRSGVFGKLMEVNENLLKDPTLINKMTDTNGYIAVILKNHPDFGKQTFGLLTEEEYEKGVPESATEGKADSDIQKSDEQPTSSQNTADKEMKTVSDKAAEGNSEPEGKSEKLDEQLSKSNDVEMTPERKAGGKIQISDEQPTCSQNLADTEMKTVHNQATEDNVEPENKRKKLNEQVSESNDYEMKQMEEQTSKNKEDEVMKQDDIDELKKEDDKS